MKRTAPRRYRSAVIAALVVSAATLGVYAAAKAEHHWKMHDMDRPQPPVVTPPTTSTQDKAGQPPSDAVVLFDGKSLDNWTALDGSAPKWIVKDGYMECVPHSGFVQSKQKFGDCQLHVEFREPTPPEGTSQGRGNSGVFLQGLYEVQVLDNYHNKTYADGSCGAVYGQSPPLANACTPPGTWETYDIVYHRPRFDAAGKVTQPANVTVFLNGILVQDHWEITGPTAYLNPPPYHKTPDKLPLQLQDHHNPIRYRNIWVRPLE